MKRLISLLVMLISVSAYCQDSNLKILSDKIDLKEIDYAAIRKSRNHLEFSLFTGYGTNSMLSLKNLQDDALEGYTIPLMKTTSFPGYVNYTFRLGYGNSYMCNGLIGGLISTGSRSSYADYSGYITSDINCSAAFLGYYFAKELETFNIFDRECNVGFSLNLSFLYSRIRMEDNLNLYASSGSDYNENQSYDFNAIGGYSQPFAFFRCMFSKHLGFEIDAGGAVNLSTPLYYQKIRNKVEFYNEKRYVQWNGFRASVGLIAVF